MEKPPLSSRTAIAVVVMAIIAHFGTLFFDGLTIARTQQQLSQAISKNPERYMQLAKNPLYLPLFSSYNREVELLNQIARARDKKDPAELSALIARTKLNLNPLFRNVLRAEDKSSQQKQGRELFLQLARPAIDSKIVSIYQQGRTLLSSMGIELPELRSS